MISPCGLDSRIIYMVVYTLDSRLIEDKTMARKKEMIDKVN